MCTFEPHTLATDATPRVTDYQAYFDLHERCTQINRIGLGGNIRTDWYTYGMPKHSLASCPECHSLEVRGPSRMGYTAYRA